MMRILAKKLSLVAAISDLKVRPLQDFGLNYTSEMVAHKGNEERQENCFTIERLESNGILADEISGAKDQAQIPHNKILTAETEWSLQTRPLLRNEQSAWT